MHDETTTSLYRKQNRENRKTDMQLLLHFAIPNPGLKMRQASLATVRVLEKVVNQCPQTSSIQVEQDDIQ